MGIAQAVKIVTPGSMLTGCRAIAGAAVLLHEAQAIHAARARRVRGGAPPKRVSDLIKKLQACKTTQRGSFSGCVEVKGQLLECKNAANE